ncbi:MAG: hypothetical protein A2V99_15225 [Spirochaetes bacterium RBG_16_67_19]|nr:MAG: hypothetical protein A2V99_15225 [Spirochaetes bacterium RBG_16_67_19]
MKVLRSILLALGLLAALAGCASLGPPFQPLASVPSGKAVVYFYRPSSFVGSAVSFTVNAGELPIISLSNGGYFPYIAAPGRISFWAKTEAESFVIIDVEPGLEYYLKGTVGMGILVGRPKLEQVPAAMGRLEILDCKLIPFR